MEIEAIGDYSDLDSRDIWKSSEPNPITIFAVEKIGQGTNQIDRSKSTFPSMTATRPVIPVSSSWEYDTQADEEILQFCQGGEFGYRTFAYRYQGYDYEIQILNNPQTEVLWAEGMRSTSRLSCVFTAATTLPFWLESHITELAHRVSDQVFVDLKATRSYLPSVYAAMRPVVVATSIADPRFDREISELFSSPFYMNRVFHYLINGEFYSVRLIHNPENNELSWTQSFQFLDEGNKTFTLNWANKYGIFLGDEAPQELIDHISAQVPASWWDWWMNFKIYNGSYVTFNESKYYITYTEMTTYTTTSWFAYTNDQYREK